MHRQAVTVQPLAVGLRQHEASKAGRRAERPNAQARRQAEARDGNLGRQRTRTDLTVRFGSRQLQQTQVLTLLQNFTAQRVQVSQLLLHHYMQHITKRSTI